MCGKPFTRVPLKTPPLIFASLTEAGQRQDRGKSETGALPAPATIFCLTCLSHALGLNPENLYLQPLIGQGAENMPVFVFALSLSPSLSLSLCESLSLQVVKVGD